jgi:two-component system, OmpR family, response regulator RpaA
MARVLVIDDEPDVLLLCRVNLQHAGHTVFEAPDGERGLALAREVRPDAVVIDLMLPVMDGFELLQALDVDRTTQDVTLLVLSARARHEDRLRCLRGGADAFVTKPFVPDALVRTIRILVGMSSAERAANRAVELAEAEAENA